MVYSRTLKTSLSKLLQHRLDPTTENLWIIFEGHYTLIEWTMSRKFQIPLGNAVHISYLRNAIHFKSKNVEVNTIDHKAWKLGWLRHIYELQKHEHKTHTTSATKAAQSNTSLKCYPLWEMSIHLYGSLCIVVNSLYKLQHSRVNIQSFQNLI